MNKTEKRYVDEVLEPEKKAGTIIDYRFEGIKLRLATKTFYTPDFVVVTEDCLEFHEVKGFWRDDARVKIKVATEQHWWFRFIAVQYKRGGWKREEFN